MIVSLSESLIAIAFDNDLEGEENGDAEDGCPAKNENELNAEFDGDEGVAVSYPESLTLLVPDLECACCSSDLRTLSPKTPARCSSNFLDTSVLSPETRLYSFNVVSYRKFAEASWSDVLVVKTVVDD